MKNITIVAHPIKKDKISQEKIAKLRKNLEKLLSTANKLNDLRENLLINFFKLALNYIQQNFEKENIINRSYASEMSVKSSSTTVSIQKKSTLNTVEDDEPEKKSSMKTAGDVKKRIQWDEMINKDFITVGYIDRFVGLKECQFNMFDWGDIVLADINALAIPEHRIQYFKYKNEIIWNKETRLDNVFGSTGSNITIYDVIERLKDVSNSSLIKIDNELNINDFDEDDEEKNVKTNQKPPNYFFSIPINDAELKENLFNLRCDLIDSNGQVEHFLLPEQSYHLTLFTLRIETDEELDTIRNLLDVVQNEQDVMCNFPIELNFQGIDEFYNKVLHVKCKSEQMNKLENLRDVLVKKIKMVGINSEAGNYYSFVPHLTIFKINKMNINTMKAACSSNTHLKKLVQPCVNTLVNQHLMKKYIDFNFGKQNLNELYLSKMVNIYDMKKYPVEYKLKLNN
jgi:2'-5' RNA ligase